MWRKTLLTLLLVLFVSSFAGAAEERFTIPIDNCPVLGPPDAPITIIEFLDFQ